MAKHWKEKYQPSTHINHMWGDGCEPDRTKDQVLDPTWVYFVRECGFTFEFHSLEQLEVCLAHFDQKMRPSTRIPEDELWKFGGDHGERQRWFERLPGDLFANTKRERIVKALSRAMEHFQREAGQPATEADEATPRS
jgi:hypothetical protein